MDVSFLTHSRVCLYLWVNAWEIPLYHKKETIWNFQHKPKEKEKTHKTSECILVVLVIWFDFGRKKRRINTQRKINNYRFQPIKITSKTSKAVVPHQVFVVMPHRIFQVTCVSESCFSQLLKRNYLFLLMGCDRWSMWSQLICSMICWKWKPLNEGVCWVWMLVISTWG